MASGAECQGADCQCKLVGPFPLANEKTQLEYPKPKRKNKEDEETQLQLVRKQLEYCKIDPTYIGRDCNTLALRRLPFLVQFFATILFSLFPFLRGWFFPSKNETPGQTEKDTKNKNQWVCHAPDCCNNKKFFSPIQLRNHLYQKFGIPRTQQLPDQVIYNMGYGIIAFTPDDAMEKFFEREFEDIKSCSEKPHTFKCIPDSYNYGPIVTKVPIDQTEGKPCRSGNDASIAGKKVEEKLVNKLRNAFEELDVKNTVMISGFQDKSQGKKDQKSHGKKDQKSQGKNDQKSQGKSDQTSQEKNIQQLEIDILIICKDTKTIIQIESKKKFDEFAKKDKMKAFNQLDDGYKYFNSKIPFLAGHGWQYVKVAYFEEGWRQEENCAGCDPYVLTQNSDIFEWIKKMKVSNTPTMFKSTYPTYICILKFLFYQMYQNEDCITQDDLLQLSERNIETIFSFIMTSLPEKVLFFTDVQFQVLNDKDLRRVVFLSQFGTGKTILLKEKARRLLEDGQKVAFVIFKDMGLQDESFLFRSYQIEFEKFENAKFIPIPISVFSDKIKKDLKKCIQENPSFHFFMDEVPVGPLIETINEISGDPSLQHSYLWFACQSENARDKMSLEGFYCPEMPHPLRYSANLLQNAKAIKIITGGTSFPSDQTKPDVYLNRGPRAIYLTMNRGTNLACAVEQLAHILDNEKSKTLIKIDFESEKIVQKLQKSQISKKLVFHEDPDVSSKDIWSNLTGDKILMICSRDNGLIRGSEFPILVHFTERIIGDQVEQIYSRCKSKLIVVCNEDIPKQLVPNNASCDFAQLIHVNDKLMPNDFEDFIKDKKLQKVLDYIQDKKRPLPIDAMNKASQTGLMIACISGDPEMVDAFLTNGANLDVVDAEGWTPIHHASKNGCLEIVKRVDEAMSKLNLKHYDYKQTLTMKTNIGESALHIAVEEGHLKVVQYLVTKNFFDVNDKTTDHGHTPLYLASKDGHSDVVRYLVNECKADVNLKSKYGWTPLHLASFNGHSDVVRCLVNDGKSDVNLKNDDGYTPLHFASRDGHSDVVRCLVNECKADVNLKDDDGYTPLHFASSEGHSDVVRFLVNECKADVNLKNNFFGDTPLHDASLNGHSDVVRCLVNECKADVNLKNDRGSTPLHLASSHGHSDVVRCLVNECKADVHLKDNFGQKPIDMADNEEIESFLKSKSQLD